MLSRCFGATPPCDRRRSAHEAPRIARRIMSGNVADGLLLDVRELDLTDLELAESEIKLPPRPAYI
jgi:hypothetical protein